VELHVLAGVQVDELVDSDLLRLRHFPKTRTPAVPGAQEQLLAVVHSYHLEIGDKCGDGKCLYNRVADSEVPNTGKVLVLVSQGDETEHCVLEVGVRQQQQDSRVDELRAEHELHHLLHSLTFVVIADSLDEGLVNNGNHKIQGGNDDTDRVLSNVPPELVGHIGIAEIVLILDVFEVVGLSLAITLVDAVPMSEQCGFFVDLGEFKVALIISKA